MQFGHFDDDAKEYVIDRPDTPRSWSNYLGSTEYGAIITNNAGGYGFYRSAAQGRFTRLRFNAIPMDQPGRYFYLRDNETGDYWSASWQPVGKDLDEYKSTCRHGTAYTIIESQYAGITSEATYFVPLGRSFECWVLTLTNASDRPRRLSVFNYLEYVSNWNTEQDLVNIQYSAYTVRGDVVDGLIRHATINNVPADPDNFENNDQGRHTFMGLVGAEAAGFDTNREAFLGDYRSYASPSVVERGACSGSLAYGDNACGCFEMHVELEPGESREMMIVVGVGKAEREGKAVLAEFDSVAKARAALAELKAHWHALLGALTVRTPDAEFDSMINVWNAYNCLITFAWSRTASLVYNGERDGLGYRDTVQDFLGVLAAIPDPTRERLELMITGQCSTGCAMRLVKPFAHHPGREAIPPLDLTRSDDCLWLFNSVPAYVKETGDVGFFDKPLPYADAGEATVLVHLRRAIEFNFDHVGDHGLPCGLEADWNDCINFGPKGESVFVAFQLRFALVTYIEICRRLERADEIAWATERLAHLDERIAAFAWDGQWFRRGTREDGSVLGTRDDPEGSIFLNPQSWSVLSGYASDAQARAAMNAVHERLATDYGVMVCAPPFEKTDYHVVRAVLMNPGVKENGGIFCHPQGWAVMAEAMLGRGERAYEYCRAYMPAAMNTRAEVRQIEPYVHCQSTHSTFSPKCGTSRIPWLSGTASWSYYSATQYILGVRPEYDGLRIDPCLPPAWREIHVTRVFRGKRFDITIRNGSRGKGVASMRLNGQAVEGDLLPIDACTPENLVVVQLA